LGHYYGGYVIYPHHCLLFQYLFMIPTFLFLLTMRVKFIVLDGFFFPRIELCLSLLLPCLLNLGVDDNCSLSYNWVESSVQISICEVLSPFPHLNSMSMYNNYLVYNDQFIISEFFFTNSWDGGFHVIVLWVLLNFQYRKC